MKKYWKISSDLSHRKVDNDVLVLKEDKRFLYYEIFTKYSHHYYRIY